MVYGSKDSTTQFGFWLAIPGSSLRVRIGCLKFLVG